MDEERLSAFLDGEVGPLTRHRLARHLMSCEECAARAGRLLGVKHYLRPTDQETGALSGAFWRRLDQALDLVDSMNTRRSPALPGLARHARGLALAGAALVVLLLIGLARLVPTPPAVQPQTLAGAHQTLLAQASPGPLHPVGWGDVPAPPAVGAWLPQAQTVLPEGLTHELFIVAGVRLSLFTINRRDLSLRGLQPVEINGHAFRLGMEGPTSLLAWQESGRWHVLAANTSPPRLLLLAGSRPHLLLP